MTRPLEIFYMCEPGRLEWQSVCLLASIRKFCLDDIAVTAYCSASRFDKLDRRTVDYHEKAGVEIVPIDPESRLGRANSPGLYQRNKIVACAHRRDSDYSLFMDTDMLFIDKVSFNDLLSPDSVHALAAYRPPTATGHVPDAVWDTLYGKFDLPTPRAHLKTRIAGEEILVMPYFNAGIILFPEKAAKSRAPLGETWLEVARKVDRDRAIPQQRAFLDQTTLPIAIAKAGFSYQPLHKGFNRPLPRTGQLGGSKGSTKIIHYHVGENLLNFEDPNLLNQLLRGYTPYADFPELIDAYGRSGFDQRPGVARKLVAKTSAGSNP